MDRKKYLGFVVFPAGIAAMLVFLFFIAKVDIFRARTFEQSVIELQAGSDPGLRSKAAADLMRRKDPRAVTPLRNALKDPSAGVRCSVALALSSLAGPSATADVATLARNDESPDVRRVAAYVLGASGDPAAREPLRAALADPVEPVRWNVAVALARLGDPAGVPVLHEMLRAPTPRSIGGAIRTLAPGAEMAAAEPDRAVHANALLSLGLVGGPESVRPIQAFIDADVEPDLNALARETIAKVGARQPKKD